MTQRATEFFSGRTLSLFPTGERFEQWGGQLCPLLWKQAAASTFSIFPSLFRFPLCSLVQESYRSPRLREGAQKSPRGSRGEKAQ